MAGIKRRRWVSQISRSPVAYIVMIVISGLFIFSSIKAYSKSRLAKEKLDVARAEVSQVRDQKTKLAKDIEIANTEYGLEKAIREKLNVVKEGEKVIMVVKEDPEEAVDIEKDSGFWSFVKGLFGGGE